MQSGLNRAVTAKNSKSTIFSGVGQPADRNLIHLRAIRGVIESNLFDKVALFLCTFFKIYSGFFAVSLFLTPCILQRNTKSCGSEFL